MNKDEAQTFAEKLLELTSNYVAVIWSTDGTTWQAGTHFEPRYLATYFPKATEIWIAKRADTPEWTCYMSPGNPPDYVAETGATGRLADILNALSEMDKKETDEQS